MVSGLFDNYEYFYLNLVAFSTNITGGALANVNDVLLNINIRGLNIINKSLEPNKDYAVLGQARFNIGIVPITTLFNSNNSVIIKRSNKYTTLNIFFTRVTDNQMPSSVYPNPFLFFEITPCLVD
jgi:hypothetical protein